MSVVLFCEVVVASQVFVHRIRFSDFDVHAELLECFTRGLRLRRHEQVVDVEHDDHQCISESAIVHRRPLEHRFVPEFSDGRFDVLMPHLPCKGMPVQGSLEAHHWFLEALAPIRRPPCSRELDESRDSRHERL